MTFVILHGWENHRPAGHWQQWLAGELRDAGHDVVYPQLPDPDAPALTVWLDTLERLLEASAAQPVTLVAHSLACSLWIEYVRSGRPRHSVERVALVAVPSPTVLASTIVRQFAPPGGAIVGPGVEVFASDDDPYCPEGVWSAFDVTVPVHSVEGAGHFTIGDGFGRWPRILDWSLATLVSASSQLS